GLGPNMDTLMQEWKQLRDNDYKLKFVYPTEEEKQQLRVIHKVAVGKGKVRRRNLRQQRELLLQAVQRGELDPDQLILELEALKRSGKRV
ncbi:hypothetical protein C7E19_18195, partial [Stenotrophomonas maltophilia]